MTFTSGRTGCLDFRDWTGGRAIVTVGTNSGATTLPFQGWRHCKEAFAPEFVERALTETPGSVEHVVDPFGGSGTTSLAAQFLGARSTAIEVNPFLADLIEAKIAPVDLDAAAISFGQVVDWTAREDGPTKPVFPGAPATLVEPGINGRYVFSHTIARRILAYRRAIEAVSDEAIRRLFRVVLGSALIPASNVVVSGKGRRYRRGWQVRDRDPEQIDTLFRDGVLQALYELRRYSARRCRTYRVLRGDARQLASEVGAHDVAAFSPPYPNSFDYTDVYNVELWALGYLDGAPSNSRLRNATLRSHVQILRDYNAVGLTSATLLATVDALQAVRACLWNRHIPEMIAAYTSDMATVIGKLAKQMRLGGRVYMVVGDSRYAGVHVPVATILSEVAVTLGYALVRVESCRSMRASPQQGGRHELPESLVVLERR